MVIPKRLNFTLHVHWLISYHTCTLILLAACYTVRSSAKRNRLTRTYFWDVCHLLGLRFNLKWTFITQKLARLSAALVPDRLLGSSRRRRGRNSNDVCTESFGSRIWCIWCRKWISGEGRRTDTQREAINGNVESVGIRVTKLRCQTPKSIAFGQISTFALFVPAICICVAWRN